MLYPPKNLMRISGGSFQWELNARKSGQILGCVLHWYMFHDDIFTLYEIGEQCITFLWDGVFSLSDVLKQPENVVPFKRVLPSRYVVSEIHPKNLSTEAQKFNFNSFEEN